MKKPLSQYDAVGRNYYHKQKALGWKSYLVFGNPVLIADLKHWLRAYKLKHKLYIRVPRS